MLTDEHVNQFNEQGFCIVKGLFSPEEVKEIQSAMDEVNAAQEKRNAAVFHPHEKNPVFKKVMSSPKITGAAAKMVNGKKVQGLQSAMYYKPPGSLGRDAHQENFYHRTDVGATVTVWMAMDKADPENGAMWGYPGTHKCGILPIVEDKERMNLDTDDNGFKKDRGLACAIPAEYQGKKASLNVEPGDVIFVHNQIIHGSDENSSQDRLRRAFICVYIKEGCEFYQGEHAKRKPIDVESAAMGGIG